jgi:protocatechuate 3,4-dioxygenase beta subunit
MSRLALAILSINLCVVGAAPVGPGQAGGASVTGVVVGSASGEPIADATVTLYAPTLPDNRISTQTDDKGAFAFPNLVAGRYHIGASKQGFLAALAGEPRYRAGGRAFTLRAGEQHDVRLRLPRLGVITGRIVDERGNPVVGASVQAWTSDLTAGYRMIRSRSMATTDDRGLYRVHSLTPERYVICAAPSMAPPPLDETQRLQREIDFLRREAELTTGPRSDAARDRLALLEPRLPPRVDPVRGFAPVCHADATGARTTIDLGPDEERSGVDLRFSRTTLARVEGRVVGLALDANRTASARLLNEDQALGDVREMVRVFRDGRIFFRDVPPGRYAMVVTADPVPGVQSRLPVLAASSLVVAGNDLVGVALQVPRPASVEGQVVFRGRRDPAAGMVTTTEIRLSPVTRTAVTRVLGTFSTTPDANGRFMLENVWPGDYRITVRIIQQPTTWFTEAVTLAGRDVALDGVEVAAGQALKDVVVTLTDRRASLAGTVLDENGEAATEFLVLLYPTESRYWTVQSQRFGVTRATPDGDFVITGLRPGTYRLVTLRDVDFGAWFDPEFLRGLEAESTPVSITGDGQTILNVRVRSTDR